MPVYLIYKEEGVQSRVQHQIASKLYPLAATVPWFSNLYLVAR